MPFIEENEEFLDQVNSDRGTTNLGIYYNQFKMEKEKRKRDKFREEIEAQVKNLALPDEMKRDLVIKKVEAMFPNNRTRDNHNLEPHPHNNQQMFDNFNGVQRMPIGNPNQDMRFNMRINDNGMQRNDGRMPNTIPRQLPPQMQISIQNQHQNMLNNQRLKHAQNQIGIPMPGKLPPQIENQMRTQVPRMDIPGGHMPLIPSNNQGRPEIQHRGRNFTNSRDNLAPTTISRNPYNSPRMSQNPRGHPQNQFSHSPSRLHKEPHQPQRERGSINPRNFPQATLQHHKVHQNPSPSDDFQDENFFPKNSQKVEFKDQTDEIKELVRLGILPEDYENISVSDDSD